MAKPAAHVPQYIEVEQTIADAFDDYCAATARCQELDRRRRPHDKLKRDMADVLKEAIARNGRALLPDGREIAREDVDRHRKAQPPSDYIVTTFREVGA